MVPNRYSESTYELDTTLAISFERMSASTYQGYLALETVFDTLQLQSDRLCEAVEIMQSMLQSCGSSHAPLQHGNPLVCLPLLYHAEEASAQYLRDFADQADLTCRGISKHIDIMTNDQLLTAKTAMDILRSGLLILILKADGGRDLADLIQQGPLSEALKLCDAKVKCVGFMCLPLM